MPQLKLAFQLTSSLREEQMVVKITFLLFSVVSLLFCYSAESNVTTVNVLFSNLEMFLPPIGFVYKTLPVQRS